MRTDYDEMFRDDIVELLEKSEAEIDRLKNMTYCAYCGIEFPLDDEAANQVSEHIRTCDKHPLREAEALAAEMRGELDKLTQELYDSKYIATSRKELLEEVKQLLDDIYAEDIVSSGDLGKVYEKVAKELGDE